MPDCGLICGNQWVTATDTILGSGKNVVIAWVNAYQVSTASNGFVTFYCGNTTTAAYQRLTVDIPPGQRATTEVFGDGLTSGVIIKDGCRVLIGGSLSWANVCYRTTF